MAMSSSIRRRSGLTDEGIGCSDIGSSSRAEGRPFMLGARPGPAQPLTAVYECAQPRPSAPPAERVRAWAQSCHSFSLETPIDRARSRSAALAVSLLGAAAIGCDLRQPHRVGPALLEIDMCRSPQTGSENQPSIIRVEGGPQTTAYVVSITLPRLVRRRSTAQPLGPSRDTARRVWPTPRRAGVGRRLYSQWGVSPDS